jgi:hypothetical protein
MFSVAVQIERENELFAATVANMEDQMAATGRDEDEALTNARLLFMATVDDALERGASIQFATGQEAVTLELPVWMAPKFFHLLEQKLMEGEEDEYDKWVSIVAAPAVSAHAE